MGITRVRPSAEIREQAIKTARKKYDEGCDGCAAGYLRLAREHGASDSEILAPEPEPGMSRRGFVRFAAAALVAAGAGGATTLFNTRTAAATGSQGHPAISTYASANPITGYFGVDSCTSVAAGTAAGMPLQFYIAELGATRNGLRCFDKSTSAYAGENFTHGYWGLCGPNYTGGSPFAYGQAQARAALDAWNTTPGVAARTIFADVESGFGGWGDGASHSQHADLLDGFLVTIAQAGFVPGVYIANSSRNAWFPHDYFPAAPFVYWVAGGRHANTMCAPCAEGCGTLRPVVGYWNDSVARETFGGQAAVIWQYWLSDGGCGGDFNYSPQSGEKAFTPVQAG